MVTIILIIILSVFFFISVYNLFTAPVLKLRKPAVSYPSVSILVPARNEESNIDNCIKNLLKQDYANKQIIVLDDLSTDKTFEIASSYLLDGVEIVRGIALPTNWLGKNWACNQLAQKASGDILLFVDADVELKPSALSSAILEMQKSDIALLSIFSTQKIKSFGEHLIVPLMNWLLLTFLPLKFVYKSRNNSFVAANGQFMLWRKDVYDLLGGHKKVKDKVVEDMELARLCKKNGYKIKTVLGGNLVYCKMYNSFNEAYNGFVKNFYSGFSINFILFIVLITFLVIVFITPMFIINQSSISFVPIILVIVSRIFIAIKSKQNILLSIILHPVQMILMFWIGIVSVIKSKSNSLVWKNRVL